MPAAREDRLGKLGLHDTVFLDVNERSPDMIVCYCPLAGVVYQLTDLDLTDLVRRLSGTTGDKIRVQLCRQEVERNIEHARRESTEVDRNRRYPAMAERSSAFSVEMSISLSGYSIECKCRHEGIQFHSDHRRS